MWFARWMSWYFMTMCLELLSRDIIIFAFICDSTIGTVQRKSLC